jgi:acyl-CoA reductase-like NAD-dependent aldehyde dehydrogenase
MDIDWISRSQALKPQVRDFIGGRWQSEGSDASLEKFSPRDGHLLYRFATGGNRRVDEAVISARRAFEDGRWSSLSVQRRKDVLYRLADLIEDHREELALLECLDVGKPITDAFNIDVPIAVANIRFNAEAADKFYGKVYSADKCSLSYELRRPLGVVAGIVGWNFPLFLAAQKIGPVLATGNSLVLKPSELTSLSASRIAEMALEAGVPEGVFNVIHGDARVGNALALHPDVDLVSFTGSSRTGKKLMIAAGQSNMKRLVLECGGKAPIIVFDDCPSLDAAAEAVLVSAFSNQGEVCVASSRLLIQDGIRDEFLKVVTEKVAALSPGDPLNPETRFGALVSQDHKKKVLDYVDSGTREGARLVYRSHSPPPYEQGFYVAPIIVDNVSAEQGIAREEIFGPVLSVLTFRDEAQAIDIANSTSYGLSAILWTKDVGRAHRIAHRINAGWIVVNACATPRGGPSDSVLSVGGHKESGIGTEGGIDGLDAYMSKTALQIFV